MLWETGENGGNRLQSPPAGFQGTMHGISWIVKRGGQNSPALTAHVQPYWKIPEACLPNTLRIVATRLHLTYAGNLPHQ
jgi:hypothetical protein